MLSTPATCKRCERPGLSRRSKIGLCDSCGTYFYIKRKRDPLLTVECFIELHPSRIRREIPAPIPKEILVLDTPKLHQIMPGFLYVSDSMRDIHRFIDKIAQSEATVLITGETGVGKELVARALHTSGERNGRPFIVVDCTSLADTLVESELFGHEQGAFTGAVLSKKGLFDLADQGTIFLDEISELPMHHQAKLLRVLETGTFRRVGGILYRKVSFRVIAATNRDLEVMVREGKFRIDLYHRLDILTCVVPPLRERKRDILPLANHFLKTILPRAELTPEAATLLQQYYWPGNVRELRNLITRIAALMDGKAILPHMLPSRLRDMTNILPPAIRISGTNSLPTLHTYLDEVRREYILSALKQYGSNITATASILGVDPTTIWRLLHKYNMTRKQLLRSQHRGSGSI